MTERSRVTTPNNGVLRRVRARGWPTHASNKEETTKQASATKPSVLSRISQPRSFLSNVKQNNMRVRVPTSSLPVTPRTRPVVVTTPSSTQGQASGARRQQSEDPRPANMHVKDMTCSLLVLTPSITTKSDAECKATEKTIAAYCKKHAFDLQIVEGESSAQKCLALATALDSAKYAYIMWIDGGATVMDFGLTPEPLLRLSDDAELIICRDQTQRAAVDASVFIVRCSQMVRMKLGAMADKAAKATPSDKGDLFRAEICNWLEEEMPRACEKLHKCLFSQTLAAGYPVRTRNICILHEHVMNSAHSRFIRLDQEREEEKSAKNASESAAAPGPTPRPGPEAVVNIFPWGDFDQTIVRATTPATKDCSNASPRKIPRIIHQTYETLVLPSLLTGQMNKYKEMNPDYVHKYYTTAACRRQIVGAVEQKLLDDAVLQAYDVLYPGAFKADLWRMCCVYLDGGVYADVKTSCTKRLDDIIHETDNLLFVQDWCQPKQQPRAALWNGVVAAEPRHPLIKATIDSIVDNIKERRLGVDPLDVTGPIVFGKTVYRKLGYPELGMVLQPSVYSTDFGQMRLLELKQFRREQDVADQHNTILFKRRWPLGVCPDSVASQLFQVASGKIHYCILWHQQKVFGNFD